MRDISAEKLIKIFEEHEKWLSTDEKEGECANLSDVDLSDADLRGACLEDADLYRADLYRADLMAANLSGANLSEVLGLNIEQLSTVETLYEAELDPELMEQVRKKYPHLLEEPEYEE